MKNHLNERDSSDLPGPNNPGVGMIQLL
jgi:hypothetical protein